MEYVKEILQRANIKNIREFLLLGVGDEKISEQGSSEQLRESYENIHRYICESPLHMDNEDIYDEVMQNVCQAERVHMEIGLICGFRLACQLLDNAVC